MQATTTTTATPMNKQQHLQAIINIGTIGHVANGKTTLVSQLTGINTLHRHSSDMQRNMTIHLGYANTKIMYCEECDLYTNLKSDVDTLNQQFYCDTCNGELSLKRHVSFVDCPGHHELMSVMLSGAAVMNSAILLSAFKQKKLETDKVVESQTIEHLVAAELMNLKQLIILQNKIDLAPSREAIFEHYVNIRKETDQFSLARRSIVVPVSAQMGYNIDYVLRKIVEQSESYVSKIEENADLPARMIIIRSFDINKPSADWRSLCGGVAGGTLIQGSLKLGDTVELRPGLVEVIQDGKKSPPDKYKKKYKCTPIITTVRSLSAEKNSLQMALPGGLIGVGTDIDPTLTKCDRLVGQVLGHLGTLPDILISVQLKYELHPFLVENVVKMNNKSEKTTSAVDLKLGDELMLTIGSRSLRGKVEKKLKGKRTVTVRLDTPVCAANNERVAICYKVQTEKSVKQQWRLIGCGIICTEGSEIIRPSEH